MTLDQAEADITLTLIQALRLCSPAASKQVSSLLPLVATLLPPVATLPPPPATLLPLASSPSDQASAAEAEVQDREGDSREMWT